MVISRTQKHPCKTGFFSTLPLEGLWGVFCKKTSVRELESQIIEQLPEAVVTFDVLMFFILLMGPANLGSLYMRDL